MPPKPGNWVETTAQHEDTLQGQTEEVLVLRSLPPIGNASSSRLHPARQPTQQQAASQGMAHLPFPPTPSLLKAFKPAYVGEPAGSIEARVRVMDVTWAAFEARIREEQCSLDLQCFNQMHAFQRQSMLAQRQRITSRVPSIILSSKGPVTGDRLDTSKLLMKHLEEQMNAYTVMLEPAHFLRGAGAAVSEMLLQLAKVAGPENMEALHQWYEDQTVDQPQAGLSAPAQHAAGTPTAAMQQAAGAAAVGATAQPAVVAPAGTAATSAAGGKLGKSGAGPSKPALRERKPAPQVQGQRTVQFSQTKAVNRARPLMVVVQGAEEVSTCALKDLLSLLLLDYARFPACLVLGCSRPAHEFLSNLPDSCLGRMERKSYDLSSTEDRLASLFKELLSSPTPIVLPSERVLRGLMQQFELYEGDVASLMRGLHAMHLLHHSSQPLASLAQVAWGKSPTIDLTGTSARPSAVIDLTGADDDDDQQQKQQQQDEGKQQKKQQDEGKQCKERAGRVPPQDGDQAPSSSAEPHSRRDEQYELTDRFAVPAEQLRGQAADQARKAGIRAQPPRPLRLVIEEAISGLPAQLVVALAQALAPDLGPADEAHGDLMQQGRSAGAVRAGQAGGGASRGTGNAAAGKKGVKREASGLQVADGAYGAAGNQGMATVSPRQGEDGANGPQGKHRWPSKQADVEAQQANGSAGQVEEEVPHKHRGRPPRHAAAGAKAAATQQSAPGTLAVPAAPPSTNPAVPANKQAAATKTEAGPTAVAQADAVKMVAAAVAEASEAHARWRLGVQWVSQVAEATGAACERPDYSLPFLYLNACSLDCSGHYASFVASTIRELCEPISRFSIHRLQQPYELSNLREVLEGIGQQAQELQYLPDVEQLMGELRQVLEEKPADAQQQQQQQEHQEHEQQQQQQQQEHQEHEQQQQQQQEHQEHEQQQQQQAAAMPQQRSSQPKSKKARDAELRAATLTQANTAAANKAPSSKRALAAAPAPPQRPTPQACFAVWCSKVLQTLLAQNPFQLAGSAVFTFDDMAALERLGLHAEPRAALHHALVHSSSYLGHHVVDDANPLSTDVEILYQRLLGQDTHSVKSWFDDYCEVALRELGGPDAGDNSGRNGDEGGQKNKKEKKRAASKAPPVKQSKRPKAGGADDDTGPNADQLKNEQQLEERAIRYAACFSQAAAELEHMGIVRPSRRKKGQNVQRMFYPPEAAPAEFGLEESSLLKV